MLLLAGAVSNRWAADAAGWNRALTDALIAAAAIVPESLVVDVAAGSSDPSLEIVQRISSVRVVAMDKSSAGLALARENSERLGVANSLCARRRVRHSGGLKPCGPDHMPLRRDVFRTDWARIVRDAPRTQARRASVAAGLAADAR